MWPITSIPQKAFSNQKARIDYAEQNGLVYGGGQAAGPQLKPAPAFSVGTTSDPQGARSSAVKRSWARENLYALEHRHWPMSKMRLLVLSRACGSLERTEDVFDIYTIIFLAFAIVIFLKLRRVLGSALVANGRAMTLIQLGMPCAGPRTTTKQSNCLRKRRLSRLRSLWRSGGKA